MPEILTVSPTGQITLPAGLRAEFGLEAGDKIFGERTEAGYILKRPKKGLLDYEGFINGVSYDAETELEMAKAGLSAHVMGNDECRILKDIFALEGFLSGVHIPDNEEDLLMPEKWPQKTLLEYAGCAASPYSVEDEEEKAKEGKCVVPFVLEQDR